MAVTQTTLDVNPQQPPKRLGDDLEAALVAHHDPLRAVPDDVCEWHDAYVDGLWTPSGRLPYIGICVVEDSAPVEVKTAKRTTSNGDRETPGRWYIKQDSHQRLLDADGVYLLAVYTDVDDGDACRLVAQLVIPASLLDPHLEDRWYDSGRREGMVAKLGFPNVIAESHLGGDQ